MKKRMLLIGLLSLTSLVGCGGGNSLDVADVIYTGTPLFDVSDPAERLSFDYELEGDIESISIGRNEITTFSYKDGVLTLLGEQIPDNPGEKTITIQTSERSYRAPLIICTKIIKTAQDFQNISEDLTGTYVLGNDIDLSSISNFEPLGTYYSETDRHNSYFHGILDGNGYAIKNANVKYSSTDTTNKEIYDGSPLFKDASHQAGDNIGIFQIIGSSGVVRNIKFQNCTVSARTIGGIVAGNIMGTLQNVVVEGGSVNISTHFWDDDCNTGSIAGIVAGGANVSNVISTGRSTITSQYVDWSDDYIGQVATGGEHANDDDPYWTFWGADKVNPDTNEYVLDSNGHRTNGVYSGVGKVWGTVSNCYGLKYTVTPYQQPSRDVDFAQTHLAVNKPASGDTNLGTINNCGVYSEDGLKKASLYSSFDSTIWNIKDGSIPNIMAIYPTK